MFQKGNKLGGRKKGAPNKFTKSVKEAFKEAFDEMGGTKNLKKWGKNNETEFYKLAAKLIPTELSGKATLDVVVKDVTDEPDVAKGEQ